jgi:1,4-dihydroxy-2-naphthoyl-CoA hydrolase
MTNSIWKQPASVDGLNQISIHSVSALLGIQVTEIGPDYITGTLPVSEKTIQPYGILHGGVSVVLAESLGSLASTMCIEDLQTHVAVGVEINANHLKPVPLGGVVTGTCRPIRVGRQMHVWQIELRDEKGDLTCISRLTTAIVARRS